MSGYSANTGGPRYNGPTTAERFVDDMAANRALDRHDLPRPPQLELASITKRYPANDVVMDDERLPTAIRFMDGSLAKRGRRNRWELG